MISVSCSGKEKKTNIMNIKTGNKVLTATLADNSSVEALVELLTKGPLTIEMSDYGNMEKVGPIGTTLPGNDEQITTEPGDIILYQGSALVIYYAPNTWNFTRLGKIDNITQDELKAILGDGDITVTLELADTTTNIDQVENNNKYFQVYPNPAKEYFEITGEFETISIFDKDGKKVLSTNKNKIYIRNIPTGLYVLKIEMLNNKTAYQKLLKV